MAASAVARVIVARPAVLLAIALCLGIPIPTTKAKGRGASSEAAAPAGHPVIRTGTSTAEVEIELCNGAGRSGVRSCVGPFLPVPRLPPPRFTEGPPGRSLPRATYGRSIILRRIIHVDGTRTTNTSFVVNGDTGAIVAKGATSKLAELEVREWVVRGGGCCRSSPLSASRPRPSLSYLAPPAQLVRHTFNLRADNPLIILDQETSKVFATIKPKGARALCRRCCSAAALLPLLPPPTDLYMYFLKATFLKQDYDQLVNSACAPPHRSPAPTPPPAGYTDNNPPPPAPLHPRCSHRADLDHEGQREAGGGGWGGVQIKHSATTDSFTHWDTPLAVEHPQHRPHANEGRSGDREEAI